MHRRFFLALLAVIFISSSCCNGNLVEHNNNIRRLPGDLKPLLYMLRIHPYFDAPNVTFDPKRNQTFDGTVAIIADVVKPTSTIILNAKNLTFDKSADIEIFSLTSMKKIEVEKFLMTPENQTISIELKQELKFNESIGINIQYTGLIGDNTDFGLFKSTQYDEESGQDETVYVTQFETTGARFLFPCFDEPDYKAIFEVTIVKPKSWVALSNTLNHSTIEISNGYEEVHFEKTEIMSTYLLAIGIGDLVSIQGFTDDGILTRIWAYRSGGERMKAALESAIKCTNAMTKYTNYHLPLKKIDHLAVPFLGGAMENFGLITYGGFFVLFNPDDTENELSRWMGVASIVCHELSHHWFGDMVTNKWWGDIFIHEGFADFFENKAMSLAYPKEKTYMDFEFAKANSYIFDINLEQPDHPIITNNGSFDYITYQMGGAVIRQLEAVISREVLQKGLQSYIQKYQFSNANYQQLLDEIQNAVDETDIKDWCSEPFNVSSFMNLWLNQRGHPSLNIDYFNGTFSITQNVQNGTNEKLWPLPIFVQLINNQKRLYWSAPNYICKNGKTLPKILQIKNPAVFVNRDILGVTSAHYSPNAIRAIVDALTSFTTNLQLSPASLYAFINDVFYSAVRNGTPNAHLKNMVENVLMYQRSVFTLGIFQEFTDKIEAWLEEGRFDNALEKLDPSK